MSASIKNITRYTLTGLSVAVFLCAIVPNLAFAWNLQGSCAGVPASVEIGDTVTWSATQTSTMQPNEGHYEWSWSGTDSLSGTTQSVTKSYTTAGTKNASVVIKLVLNSVGVESITRTCKVTVTAPPPVCTLEITKSVDKTTASIGDTVTYTLNVRNSGTANCTGGGVKIKDVVDLHLNFISETHTANITGGYSPFLVYDIPSHTLYWNGNTLTPGEIGSITWSATVATPPSCGSFTIPNKASITSYEYNNFTTWVDSNTVTTNVSNICVPPIAGSCVASPSSVLIGDSTTFTATASGGTGIYTYLWTGDGSLSGTNVSVQKSYTSAGTKQADVVIASGTQNVTAHCEVAVNGPPPSPATLKVIKLVTNDDGGTKTAADFDIFVKQGSSHVSGSPAFGSASGVTFTLVAGNYTVGENSPTSLGYSLESISGDCSPAGAITLVAGEHKVCTITNNDEPAPPPVFEASCASNPSSVSLNVAVTYTATASGGTGIYTYLWTGDGSLSGTAQSVAKAYTSTGTKSAQVVVTSGTETRVATCSVVVTNPPQQTPLAAQCSVNPASIRVNESATFSATASGGDGTYTHDWTGADGLSGAMQDVTKTYTSAGSKNGLVTVISGSETVTVSCAINVLPPPGCTGDCGGGGGGFNQPTVVLLKKPPVGKVLSAVYLSQVPYTGIGDWYKIPLFILILAVWSASVVYFLRSKLLHRGEKKKKELETVPAYTPPNIHEGMFEIRGEEVSLGDWTPQGITHANNETMYRHSTNTQKTPSPAQNLSGVGGQSASTGVIEVIAAEAQHNRSVISEEGMHYLAEKSNFNAGEALRLVGTVIRNAEMLYDRDQGWLLLNKEKVMSALTQKVEVVLPATQTVHPAPTPVASQRPSATPSMPASPMAVSGQTQVDSALFINWLATGDKGHVASHLRMLRERHGAADAFLKKVILDLDAVYRSRFDEIEESLDERLAHTISGLSNQELEELISALFSMTDQNYQSTSLSLKLALMRASEIGKNRN